MKPLIRYGHDSIMGCELTTLPIKPIPFIYVQYGDSAIRAVWKIKAEYGEQIRRCGSGERYNPDTADANREGIL